MQGEFMTDTPRTHEMRTAISGAVAAWIVAGMVLAAPAGALDAYPPEVRLDHAGDTQRIVAVHTRDDDVTVELLDGVVFREREPEGSIQAL